MKTLFTLLALVGFALGQSSPNWDRVKTAVTLDSTTDSVLVSGNGYATAGFQFTGTWSGTVTFSASVDGTTWLGAYATNAQSRAADTTATENGLYFVSTSGARYVKAKFTTYTSGSAVVYAITTDDPISTSSASGGGGAEGSVDVLSIAAGNNNIGNMDIVTVPADPFGANADAASASGSISAKLRQIATSGHPVTNAGTFATQAAQSGTWTVQPGNTANTTAWKVDGSAVTQPVSGTVAVTGVATAANQSTANGHLATLAGAVAGTEVQADILTLPSVTVGTFPDNEPFNVAQINGVTPLMGAGNTGTGSPRVTIASDQANLPVNPGTAANWGVGATGSAVPANAKYAGANSAGNLTGVIQPDSSAIINMSTATTTQIVGLTSAKKIFIAAWDVIAAGTGTIKLVYGTGTNCGTGTTDLTPAYSLVAQAGIAKGMGFGVIFTVPASNALCVTTSAAVGMQGTVSYTKF